MFEVNLEIFKNIMFVKQDIKDLDDEYVVKVENYGIESEAINGEDITEDHVDSLNATIKQEMEESCLVSMDPHGCDKGEEDPHLCVACYDNSSEEIYIKEEPTIEGTDAEKILLDVSESETTEDFDHKATNSRLYAVIESTSSLKSYKCSDCTYQAKNKHDLISHFKTQHNFNISYFKILKHPDKKRHDASVLCLKCANCPYVTRIRGCMLKHIGMEHDMNVDKCPKCFFKSNCESTLVQHYREKHTNAYKCTECNFAAKCVQSLSRHLKAKHGYVYECTKCSFSTRYNQSLVRHQQAKHGDVYKCPKCSYQVKYRHRLIEHYKTKHTEKVKITNSQIVSAKIISISRS